MLSSNVDFQTINVGELGDYHAAQQSEDVHIRYSNSVCSSNVELCVYLTLCYLFCVLTWKLKLITSRGNYYYL